MNMPNTLSNLRIQFSLTCKLDRRVNIPKTFVNKIGHTVELTMQARQTGDASALERLSHVPML